MLPAEVPLFPLPNVVLFPAALLPLHIFEPRYRAMFGDALEGDRLIGMVMLRPGWEKNYEGTPPVYPVGCAGFITHADRLPDGRFNVILCGLEKFRILGERRVGDGENPYRMARIESIEEIARLGTESGLHEARSRLERLIARRLHRSADDTIPKDIPAEDLVRAIAQHLEPLEKQALLECDGPLQRCLALVELLEMKTIATPPGGKTRMH